MSQYGTVMVLLLAGWAGLSPHGWSWAYVALFAVFEVWVLRRMSAAGRTAVLAGEPPYHFTDEEAKLVGRYPFYFTFPAVARSCASVLAALGLTALLLVPWLIYKQAFVQAALIGLNLLAVSWLTRQVWPVAALQLAASRGKRDALQQLEQHDPAWAKIRAANQSGIGS
jgi:hypothetical protein